MTGRFHSLAAKRSQRRVTPFRRTIILDKRETTGKNGQIKFI
jgi:hypothetical protein